MPENQLIQITLLRVQMEYPEVKHNPNPDTDPDNYFHSLIIGKKKQSVVKYLARSCRFVLKTT